MEQIHHPFHLADLRNQWYQPVSAGTDGTDENDFLKL